MIKTNIPEKRVIPIPHSGSQGRITMWPSEYWASKIYDIANVFLIVALVLGAASTLLVVWMGNVKEGYLKKDLANTNDRAARAEERAGNLEKEAADLRKTAEDERLARVELEDRVAWRTLTKGQQAALVSSLSKFSDQLVDCSFLSSDMEAFSFSSEIATALRAAKWQVVPPNPYVLTMKETSLPTAASPIEHIDFGLEVVSTSDVGSVVAARAIVQEFKRLGFDADFKDTPQRQLASRVWITVQHRPLGPQGEAKLRAETITK